MANDKDVKAREGTYNASGPEELARLIDSSPDCWNAAREQLYDGRITAWLRASGNGDIAERWIALEADSKFKDKDPDAGVEGLIELCRDDLQAPRMSVDPARVKMIGVRAGRAREVQLTVSSVGRGQVYGTVELDPQVDSISIEPATFSANRILGTTQQMTLSLRTDEALRASTTLRFTSNGGTLSVPVSFRCVFPYMIAFPFAGALLGLLAYLFAAARFTPRLRDMGQLGFGTFIAPVVGLSVAVGALIGLFVALYARSKEDRRCWRLVMPGAVGGLISGAGILVLVFFYLPDIRNTTTRWKYPVIWAIVLVTAMIGLAYIGETVWSAAPRFYAMLLSIASSALVTGLVMISLKADLYLPPAKEAVKNSVMSINTTWVAAVLLIFLGVALGQVILESFKYPYLRKPASILNVAVVVVLVVVLLLAGLATISNLYSIHKSSTPQAGTSESAPRSKALLLRCQGPTAQTHQELVQVRRDY